MASKLSMRFIRYSLLILILFISTCLVYSQKDSIILFPSEIKGIPIDWVKVKMAYEGTWQYKSRDTTFVMRIKGVYGKSLLYFYGTYSLSTTKYRIEDNHHKLLSIINNTFLDNYMSEYLPIELICYSPPENVYCYNFTDCTRLRKESGFKVRADIFDASNNRIYWNMSDYDYHGHGRLFLLPGEPLPKGVGFSVPRKCTLTRVSHDPYFEIEKVADI